MNFGAGFQQSELENQPKDVLLQIAIELDPDIVAEKYEEGWTREDIIREIKKYFKSTRSDAPGAEYILGIEDIREVEE